MQLKNNLMALAFGITFCCLLLLISELALTILNFDNTYGFSKLKREDIFIRGVIKNEIYYTFQPDSKFRKDFFKVKKDSDTIRIFVLGGSAAFGYPLKQEEIFSYLLEEKLNKKYKNKKFEIINLAYPGYSSKDDLETFKEVLHYNPNFVILYSGNNEFLTLRHNHKIKKIIFGRISSNLNYLKIFNLAKRVVSRFIRPTMSFDEFNQFFPMIPNELLDNLNKDLLQKAGGYNEIYNLYLSDYSRNLIEITRLAKEHTIKVIILNIPVNIQWPPVKSIHIIKQDQKELLEEYIRKGDYFLQRCDNLIKNLKENLIMDPFYAETHYYLGLCYNQLGMQSKAEHHFNLASDLDAYPIRHLSTFNIRLKEIAEQEGVLFIDVIKFYKKIAQSEIFNGLFYDYNHPNKEGHEIIANAILNEMIKNYNFN